jgi:hypothetical protein
MNILVLILDLDGVLITVPLWKSDEIHEDGYSVFNTKAVNHLNFLLTRFDCSIWLSSSRRKVKTIEEFNTIFINRGIIQKLSGYLPVSFPPASRKDDLISFIDSNQITKFLIIDDDKSLFETEVILQEKIVITNTLQGFNEEKLLEALEKMKNQM